MVLFGILLWRLRTGKMVAKDDSSNWRELVCSSAGYEPEMGFKHIFLLRRTLQKREMLERRTEWHIIDGVRVREENRGRLQSTHKELSWPAKGGHLFFWNR